MPTLQQQQAPIDAEIVKAMIASTPDTWNSIRLVIERKAASKVTGDFTHELSSPEGHAPSGSDMSVFEATYKLDSLLKAHGAELRRAEYVAQSDGEDWTFSSTFEYEKKAL
jgi:hypothetical protein